MSENTLRIVTQDSINPSEGRKDPTSSASAGYWDDDAEPAPIAPRRGNLTFHEIGAEKLEKELVRVLRVLDTSLSRAMQQANLQSVELNEVEVSVAISANGSLSILGLGAEIGGSSSITLKLKPKGQ
ncbi:hypothetical protein [Oscillatoria sp. FACHB-1406]|uniref:Pepco domain-containing protein n=1 Tax=Oscillatoria sp. FACHB-1406 TaxID=2692846 RepID=UPI0016828DE0|nr:hypothetical protein [Oscillatoria sp. FACHB-1406]MBD2577324.1 hypothetical protein [Oscillatoria sp. FACHB-1406]